MKEKIKEAVILPGSYDPVTLGHLDIIKQAAQKYEEVYVVAFVNPAKKYTFYTTGMETAAILGGYEKSILYCSGGYYFPDSRGFVGSQAEAFMASVKADVCFIGASGIMPDGITTPYPMHTPLQKAILPSAKTKILVCDHSKFGKRAMEKICELKDIDIIVTDSGLSDDVHDEYSKHVKIVKA